MAAGLETREFSPLEKLAFHKVAAYDKVAGQTWALWEEISATHPGVLCYGHPKYAIYTEIKQDRDLLAHALYTGQALVGEKLIGHPEALSVINEPVTLLRRVMKDPEITVTVAQIAAHHKAYLSHLSEKESFKGYEAAHEKVVAYRQVRNFAAASYKETQQIDPPLLEKRDRLAFEIFEALGQDPGITKVVKNLLSTDRDEDKILSHAIRGEVKKVLDLYRETPNLAERGKYAAWLGSHEEGRGILRDHAERRTALLFEAKAIETFLSTERSLEAQAAFKDKILSWKQRDQSYKELINLESGQEAKPLKIAVGDSRVLRQPSVDLSALNEAICNSVDLERLARDFGFIRGKERSQTHQKEERPQALQEFYKAQKHQQQLTSEDNRYAHVKAMGAFDEAGKTLLECPQSHQTLKQQDLKTYCSLVQEHGSPALKQQVFQEVFDQAKTDSSLNPTELVKALEQAKTKEADIQQESKSPYKIHKARMNRQEAEENVSCCPTSMAYLSQKGPQTHQRLEETRQQDLQRQHQKSRGLEL